MLCVNSGSSSVKFKLFSNPSSTADWEVVCVGKVNGIGGEHFAQLAVKRSSGDCEKHEERLCDVDAAVHRVLRLLTQSELESIAICAHRVVHGGAEHKRPLLLDGTSEHELEALSQLAPLHNSANLRAFHATRHRLLELGRKRVQHYAVFDTSFFLACDMPPCAYTYGVPPHLRLRRFGFHGQSHSFLAKTVARLYCDAVNGQQHNGSHASNLRVISCHLGSGASCAALVGGRALDTSMGLTPLEGLLMGTRTGDIDPAAALRCDPHRGQQSLEQFLNTECGLKALAGESDMQRIEERAEKGDERARLAFEVFCYRVAKYVGAYFVVCGGLDALVFAGGIGEHSSRVRAAVCERLQCLGVRIDPRRNAAADGCPVRLSPDGAAVQVWMIPTDEERQMLDDVVELDIRNEAK